MKISRYNIPVGRSPVIKIEKLKVASTTLEVVFPLTPYVVEMDISDKAMSDGIF